MTSPIDKAALIEALLNSPMPPAELRQTATVCRREGRMMPMSHPNRDNLLLIASAHKQAAQRKERA